MNNQNVDWVQLWMLNELAIASQLSVSHLIDDPHHKWYSPWVFPGRGVLSSTKEDRVIVFIEAVRSGLVELFNKKSQTNPRFADSKPIDADACHELLKGMKNIDDYLAVITQKGHEAWELIYQPDWERFWVGAFCEAYSDSKTAIYNIIYSSDALLNDLIQWYPAYMGLGNNTRVVLGKTTTTWAYQATNWKLLSSVKTTEFILPSEDPVWKTLKIQGNYMNKTQKKKAINHFHSLSDLIHSQSIDAYLKLRKLSKCWACTDVCNADPRDSEPKFS